jgi:hypothetical protein
MIMGDNKQTTYNIIEKDNEIIFYIPYEKELIHLYTTDFFSLSNQDAEIAIIAFHDNDHILKGGNIESDINIPYPYKLFYDKANYVNDVLNKRFNNVSEKKSSFNLFSALMSNSKNIIYKDNDELTDNNEKIEKEKSDIDNEKSGIFNLENNSIFDITKNANEVPDNNNEKIEKENSDFDNENPGIFNIDMFNFDITKKANKVGDHNIEDHTIKDSNEIQDEYTDSYADSDEDLDKKDTINNLNENKTHELELMTGNLLQITIQKKVNASEVISKLKIPMDVILEKEIDYFHEKLPGREIKLKYGFHGIHMLI